MGLDDSPLRERVIFTEGAPRSGTTLLASLLAAHPEIAGTVAESHLFSRGVGALFENHAMRGPHQGFLCNYVSERELVDLVRELCDGVLGRMRERVKPDAGFVTEKTPAPPIETERILRQKRAVYPDAHYVHVVRDRDAVVRSLLRAPWNTRDEAGSAEWWQAAVSAARDAFGDSDRYVEIRYEELATDPVATMATLFDRLGLESGPDVTKRIEALSRERISSFGPPPSPRPAAGSPAPEHSDGLGTRLARRLRPSRRGPAATRLAQGLITAARAGDGEAIERLTSDDFELVLRSDGGDLRTTGAAARDELRGLLGALFATQLVTESWTAIGRGPVVALLLAGTLGDGARIDACFSAAMAQNRVRTLAVILLGAGGGRVPGEWSPAGSGEPR